MLIAIHNGSHEWDLYWYNRQQTEKQSLQSNCDGLSGIQYSGKPETPTIYSVLYHTLAEEKPSWDTIEKNNAIVNQLNVTGNIAWISFWKMSPLKANKGQRERHQQSTL